MTADAVAQFFLGPVAVVVAEHSVGFETDDFACYHHRCLYLKRDQSSQLRGV